MVQETAEERPPLLHLHSQSFEALTGKGCAQEPNGYTGWVPEILCEDGRNQKDNHKCNIPPNLALQQSGQAEASPERGMRIRFETKQDSQQTRFIKPQF